MRGVLCGKKFFGCSSSTRPGYRDAGAVREGQYELEISKNCEAGKEIRDKKNRATDNRRPTLKIGVLPDELIAQVKENVQIVLDLE